MHVCVCASVLVYLNISFQLFPDHIVVLYFRQPQLLQHGLVLLHFPPPLHHVLQLNGQRSGYVRVH